MQKTSPKELLSMPEECPCHDAGKGKKGFPPKDTGLIQGLAIMLMTATVLSGCSLSYLMHAAAGQLRIMHRTVPMEKAFEDQTLKPVEIEKLLLIERIKDFGERELGLTPTDNYETVYLGPETNPVYTVTAARKTRLELVTWWFPLVGRMPYLGYFDREAAEKRKKKLEEKGLDVVIWPAEAYSTLGWFQDPVHRNLLRKDPVELAETILHEMTHATLYVKGQPAFNETLASVVGKRGALAFVENAFGHDSVEAVRARAMIRDERRFSEFIEDLVSRLKSLYSKPLSDDETLHLREKVFQDVMARFTELEQELETEQFRGFGYRGLNNAYILAVALYHAHYNLFEKVLETQEGSVSGSLEIFRMLGEKPGDLIIVTKEWVS